MQRFLAALEFLTRLRVRRVPAGDMRLVSDSQAWFAAVGLIVGLILAAIDRLAREALPDASASVIVVVALVIVTGGLHLDGLADSADGLFGGHDRKRRLEIMRDVHAGTWAIVAVVSVLALKWAGLAALPHDVRTEAIILMPCLARAALVVANAAFPYARAEGIGVDFHERAWPGAAVTSLGTAAVASIVVFGATGGFAIAFACVCALALGLYARSMVGGMTGDLYGATVEITEAFTILFIAAFATRGWIEPWLF